MADTIEDKRIAAAAAIRAKASAAIKAHNQRQSLNTPDPAYAPPPQIERTPISPHSASKSDAQLASEAAANKAGKGTKFYDGFSR